MKKLCSIADARQNLAALVHQVDRGTAIGLTRRGKLVAVLLSVEDYDRLQVQRTSFWDAYSTFCQRNNLKELAIDTEIFSSQRDKSSGREIGL